MLDNLAGTVIAKQYRLNRCLGRGGVGLVYEADSPEHGQSVAVKILDLTAVSQDPNFLERFHRESVLSQKLDHPNVVRVFDHGTDGGRPFLVMEMLVGPTVDDLLAKPTLLPSRQSLSICLQAAKGLGYAHGQGIVHRDVKPANIFALDGSEKLQVKMIDFGLAKPMEDKQGLSSTGMFLGTPAYMAPEQILGLPVDQRTDIYALGIVFYELLTGSSPFRNQNTAAILYDHIKATPRPLKAPDGSTFPPDFFDIVQKALAKKPEDRFQSMEEFVAALRFARKYLPRD